MNWNFKTPPFDHQMTALCLAKDEDVFGYLMDQGTGKTWTAINDMAYQWRKDRINCVIVACPNSIKEQWAEQITEHMPDDVPVNVGIWVSQPNAAQKKALAEWVKCFEAGGPELHFMIVNVEAMGMPRCEAFLAEIAGCVPTAMIIDESTRIKNRMAKRTKAAMRIRKLCVLARIMSGTPVVKSPMDAYAQFAFLDPSILGFKNFWTFRGRYAIMGGYKGKQVVNFKHTEELARSIRTASYRVTKEECLDLPPKLYARRDVTMTTDQRREYERMRNEFLAMISDPCPTCEGTGYVHIGGNSEFNDAGYDTCPECEGTACAVSVTIALTQMLRLQQITSGFITDGPDVLHWFTEKPPKIMEVMDIIEDGGDQSFIHWSNFRPEIARLVEELAYRGLNYVEIHGGVSQADRKDARRRFQDADVAHMVANQAAGGIGLDLWRASIANYLSNSFKTEDRIQSEDRCHRIGSEVHDSVSFNDLVVPGTVDVHILRVIRNNRNLSDAIMQGGMKEMIT